MSIFQRTTCPTCGFPTGIIGSIITEDGPHHAVQFSSPCSCHRPEARRYFPDDPAFLALKDFIRNCGEDPDRYSDDQIYDAFVWSAQKRPLNSPDDLAQCMKVCGTAHVVALIDFPEEIKRNLMIP